MRGAMATLTDSAIQRTHCLPNCIGFHLRSVTFGPDVARAVTKELFGGVEKSLVSRQSTQAIAMNSVSAAVFVGHVDGPVDPGVGYCLGQGEWDRCDGNRQQRGGERHGEFLDGLVHWIEVTPTSVAAAVVNPHPADGGFC